MLCNFIIRINNSQQPVLYCSWAAHKQTNINCNTTHVGQQVLASWVLVSLVATTAASEQMCLSTTVCNSIIFYMSIAEWWTSLCLFVSGQLVRCIASNWIWVEDLKLEFCTLSSLSWNWKKTRNDVILYNSSVHMQPQTQVVLHFVITNVADWYLSHSLPVKISYHADP